MRINKKSGLISGLTDDECTEIVALARGIAGDKEIDYLHPLLHAWINDYPPRACLNTREIYECVLKDFPAAAFDSALRHLGH